MCKKVLFATILSLTMVFFHSFVCLAEDFSSYSLEEIEAEISRLEGELEVLYNLRDQMKEEIEIDETDTKEVSTDTSKVLTYTGTGDNVIEIEPYNDWHLYEIEGNSGGRYFGVIAYNNNGERLGSLVNTTDVYHGRVYENTQSAAMLEIEATGDWTIQVKSLYTAQQALKGDTVTGSGDDVVVFYTDNGESTTATVTGNNGENYFGIIGYNNSGARTGSLVNTTDVYSGNVLLKGNPCIFEVNAVGEWSITFN